MSDLTKVKEALEYYAEQEYKILDSLKYNPSFKKCPHHSIAKRSLAALNKYMDRLDSDSILDEIVDKGVDAQRQINTKWNDSHYWVAQAAINVIKGESQ